MKEGYIKTLSNILKMNNIDAMLIEPSEDLSFIIEHDILICERFQAFIIKNDGTCFYICNLLTEQEVKEVFNDKVQIYSWFDGIEFTDVVKEAFIQHDLVGKTIAVNSTARGFNLFDIMEKVNVKFVNGKMYIEEIKIKKDIDEMKKLRISSSISDSVFNELIEYIKPGLKEIDIKNKMNQLYKQKGVAGPIFGGFVATGNNGALPHYHSSEGNIKAGDMIILDFGCYYEGMCSDISRTVCIGNPSSLQREVYNVVLEANEAAEKACVEDAYIPDIENVARKIIDEAGYGKYFIHRLGHGIGYSPHEAPEIKPTNKRILEKGMAFTIEPGIYIPNNFGVRIEDVVLINEKGYGEVLNKSTKDLIII